jgi:hypothetical protein
MDGVSDFASILAVLKTNCIDVAIGLAAASLCSEAIFCDAGLGCIETIFDCGLVGIEAILHSGVDCIEAVTQTVGNAAKLGIDVLVVETFEKVRASDCTLYCGVACAVAITEQSTIAKDCEPYKINKPLCYEIADSAISLYITIKSRLYLLLKEKSCTSN